MSAIRYFHRRWTSTRRCGRIWLGPYSTQSRDAQPRPDQSCSWPDHPGNTVQHGIHHSNRQNCWKGCEKGRKRIPPTRYGKSIDDGCWHRDVNKALSAPCGKALKITSDSEPYKESRRSRSCRLCLSHRPCRGKSISNGRYLISTPSVTSLPSLQGTPVVIRLTCAAPEGVIRQNRR